MRIHTLIVPGLALFLAGCASAPEAPKQEAPKKAAPKMLDLTHYFPQEGQTGTKVVETDLYGKKYLGPGYTAQYKKGKREFEMFYVKTSAVGAALALLEYKKALKDPKLIAHFGGYFGKDGDVPAFVFAKVEWIAGVRGLPEKEADLEARELAARLP
jgi:hypothetical protein